MGTEQRRKFAVLSRILPPSPSGQAMLLGYLLSHFSPDEYCLISTEYYPPDAHAAAYHHLVAGQTPLSRLLRRFPKVNSDKNTRFHRTFRPLLRTYQRMRGDYRPAELDRLVVDQARALGEIVVREGCDALVACTGTPQEMVAAYQACRATGIAFVPFILDYYSLKHTGEQRDYALRHEGDLLRGAARVLVLNEFMAEEYRRLYGVECTIVRTPCLLHNLDRLDAAPRALPSETFNIVYTGAIYNAHYDAFHNLIAAVERLGRADVAIHLFTAQPVLKLKLAGISGQALHFHEHVDHAEVPALQRQADMLFLPLAFESLIPETINTSSPSKIGEYLSVGRPILVHAPRESFLSWYFRTHACGLVVDDNDPAVLADALARLLDDSDLRAELGAQARAQAKEFDLPAVAEQFKAVLHALRDGPH